MCFEQYAVGKCKVKARWVYVNTIVTMKLVGKGFKVRSKPSSFAFHEVSLEIGWYDASKCCNMMFHLITSIILRFTGFTFGLSGDSRAVVHSDAKEP
eukprot:1824567-Amphidinium_carterae.1